MALIVQKFGGTSVADIEHIKNVAQIIISEIGNGNQVIVVVSAMAGVTNALITKCSEVSDLNYSSHFSEYDALISTGENITAALLALELQNNNIEAQSLQGWQIPIISNEVYGNALVESINDNFLRELLDNNIIPIITGFQGVSKNNRTTTLGKGGSDTSAALISAAMKADRCDIYKDVEGIYTADPRIVHEARKINSVNIMEMMALSSSGAKVLHPRAILAALRYGFNMRVLSSFSKQPGTLITLDENIMENRLITAISFNKNLLKVEISHPKYLLTNIIRHFVDEDLQFDQIITNDKIKSSIITNLIDKNKFERILINLQREDLIDQFSININISTVTLVGFGIKNDPTICYKIIEILDEEKIELLSITISEIKITILVGDQDTEHIIKILHNYFKLAA